MSCIFPLKRFRQHDGSLSNQESGSLNTLWLPCGQCGECRISRARQWATRCTHEATRWKESSFITLTYDKNPITLNPEDTRNFIRRLREKKGKNLKYFLVGEYGGKFERPHYHALIFGYDFGFNKYKKYIDSKTEERTNAYELEDSHAITSTELDDIWSHGFTSVGELTFDSAAYCAQYATKKVNGSHADEYYETLIEETGEIIHRHPEFMRQSKNAIGKEYSLAFAQEIKYNCFLKLIIKFLSSSVRKKAKQLNVNFSFLFMRANGYQLTEITNLIDSGIIRPVVDKVFSFEQTNEAMAYVETGRAKGKVVIKVK